MRVEADSLGQMPVPNGVYYGAQTARALMNFPISGLTIGRFPELIAAVAMIKLAAARTNHRLGDLHEEKKVAIERACEDVISGRVADQFPIDVFQGGAGTSTNMNVNEVIANLALEHMGRARGDYNVVHPNNDVNQSQSTNDVYPTAIRITLLDRTPSLKAAIEELAAAFEKKASQFMGILKLGRTQLQDAVPMTLGQEFLAFAVTLRKEVGHFSDCEVILREVNLGGTAIGTGVTTDPRYQAMVLEELNQLTNLSLVPAGNLIEASWDTGALVSYSSQLKRLAVKLSKIANDLRLLSSGPRGGLGEIRLPAMQPGSSIMPGKVNPVIPEVVNQVAFHVIGADVAITLAAESGELQLNAFEPMIVTSLLSSVSLLTNVITTFATRCVDGIEAIAETCASHLQRSTALAPALIPYIGYERAATLARAKLETGESIADLLAKEGLLSNSLLATALDAKVVTAPLRVRPDRGRDGRQSPRRAAIRTT